MGGWAARKAVRVVENVEQGSNQSIRWYDNSVLDTQRMTERHNISVLAIELLAACQAIEFLRPLCTTRPLEEIHRLVRSVVGYGGIVFT